MLTYENDKSLGFFHLISDSSALKLIPLYLEFIISYHFSFLAHFSLDFSFTRFLPAPRLSPLVRQKHQRRSSGPVHVRFPTAPAGPGRVPGGGSDNQPAGTRLPGDWPRREPAAVCQRVRGEKQTRHTGGADEVDKTNHSEKRRILGLVFWIIIIRCIVWRLLWLFLHFFSLFIYFFCKFIY